MDRTQDEVAALLEQWRAGHDDALEQLLPLVYGELRAMAAVHLRGERAGHTLQTTALVHEVYLRLFGGDPLPAENRRHFMRIAAQAMRRVLIDHARAQMADKRVGAHRKVQLDEVGAIPMPPAQDVLAIHDALERLQAFRPREAHLVELRYFGGFSLEEAAELLEISRATATRSWQAARRWLHAKLADDKSGWSPA